MLVFKAWTDPERLVYTHGRDIDDDPGRFHVTVTFTDRNGKTELTMRSVFPKVEACEMVKKFGAVELDHQTLDRLGEYVAGI